MKPIHREISRRSALSTTGIGIAALAVTSRASAAEMTAAEKANVDVVNAFCAAWPSHDLAKIMSFFADNCAYRVTETQEPAKGRDAVTEKIKGFLDRVIEFKIMDAFARGPMVFNERTDRFSGGPLKSWHGVGVFFLKDGKIVEWYDYTIAIER
jgi:limonene-1,2-epoxide hydrolase